MRTSRQQAQRALDLHGDRLASRANVVGLGITAASKPSHGHAIVVYLERIVPQYQLDPEDVIPEEVEVPTEHGPGFVEVQIRQIGALSLQPDSAEEGATDASTSWEPQ